MRSPLTPQWGRIESNPREYTHMGPSTNLPDERGFSDTRAWKFGRPPNERGFSDEIGCQKPKNRPNIHPHFPTVQKSTLIRRPHISHISFVSNTRDNRKMRDKYER